MKQFTFGSGVLAAIPSNGLDPIVCGALQDVSIEFGADIKNLHGQFGFPLANGKGKQKIDIKAGNGALDVELYNNIYFANSTPAATGCKKFAQGETGTVPTTPYQITVANAATFFATMQVLNATTGARLQQVAAGPATGQFSVAAGVFTFAAADVGVAVLIDYIYTDAASGKTLTLTNQLMGAAPAFKLILAEKFDASTLVCQFNKVTSGKLTLPLKQDDFMISDLEMSAFVDATNTLGFISMTG
jgi:hypothetical protein